MTWKVLIAHANGDDKLAEALAGPLRQAGYDVAHESTVCVGESVVEEASKVLQLGGPVVLCATVRALGTAWARRVTAAARRHDGVRVFVVQCEAEADVDQVSFDEKVARYWQDPAKALKDLLDALTRHYPIGREEAEVRYRELLLKSSDLVSLANLPEDRHLAQRQLELRRLFVPLHARVEAAAGEGDDQRLQAMEDARAGRRAPGPARERAALGTRLGHARRLVVLGDPGAGKTTLTRWMATAYLLRLARDPDWQALPDVQTLPDEDWLPIIVRCRDLSGALPASLDDVLRHTLRANELSEAERATLGPLLRQRLAEGRALLLLDGLDEIAEPGLRQRFCEQLEQIHLACPKAAIVATSRIVGYREMGYHLGHGFEHLTLADLTNEEKDDFVRRWCALTAPPELRAAATEELIRDLHSNDRIERLTGNPMLLTTMALVKRNVGKLPSRRADLYREAVKVLLNWRSAVDQPIEWNEAMPQLAYVAYAMCDRGVQRLRQDELLALLARVRAEYPSLHMLQRNAPEDFLRRVEARTGLLVEAGHERHLGLLVPVYEFRHLTFQEYLAARALVDGHFPERDATRTLAQNVAPLAGRTAERSYSDESEAELAVVESWRETLRLVTAICHNDDVDPVLAAILTPGADEPPEHGRARAIQAALGLADEPNVSDVMAQRILDALAHHTRAGDGEGEGMSETGMDVTAMELASTQWTDALQDSLAREFANRPYHSRPPPGALCGQMAASSYVEIEPNWARVADLECKDPVRAIRAALAVTQAALQHSIVLHLRTGGGDARWARELPRAILKGLSRGAAQAHACAWALAWMSCAEQPWLPDERSRAVLIAYLRRPDGDPEAQSWLAAIAAYAPNEAYVEALLPLLEREHARRRRAVALALGATRDPRAVDALIARLDDPDALVRRTIVDALCSTGVERAVEPLIAKLDDPDAHMRRAVVAAFARQMDNPDRRLLSRDLHGFPPGLDPREPVTVAIARQAAAKLKLSLDDVKARYEALEPQFHLRLEWLTAPAGTKRPRSPRRAKRGER